MKSRTFLPTFNRLREHCNSSYELTGDRLLVERVEVSAELTSEVTREDGTKVSLILTPGNTNTARLDSIKLGGAIFARVLEVGKGYYDGEAQLPLDSKIGQIVLVSGVESIRWWSNIFGLFSVGEHSVGVMQEDQVLMRWDSDTAFNKYMEIAKLGFNDERGVA